STARGRAGSRPSSAPPAGPPCREELPPTRSNGAVHRRNAAMTAKEIWQAVQAGEAAAASAVGPVAEARPGVCSGGAPPRGPAGLRVALSTGRAHPGQAGTRVLREGGDGRRGHAQLHDTRTGRKARGPGEGHRLVLVHRVPADPNTPHQTVAI